MRVSQKTEYALRAMLELTLRAQPEQPVRTAEIAREQKIPEKFLELILVDLRRAGLILSQRGPIGGHRLARGPEHIAVGDIWRAIDGGSSREAARGQETPRARDPFRDVWNEVDRAISGIVDHVTLADIRRKAETLRNVADFSI